MVAIEARYLPSSSKVAYTVGGAASMKRSECKTSSTWVRSTTVRARGCGAGSRFGCGAGGRNRR